MVFVYYRCIFHCLEVNTVLCGCFFVLLSHSEHVTSLSTIFTLDVQWLVCILKCHIPGTISEILIIVWHTVLYSHVICFRVQFCSSRALILWFLLKIQQIVRPQVAPQGGTSVLVTRFSVLPALSRRLSYHLPVFSRTRYNLLVAVSLGTCYNSMSVCVYQKYFLFWCLLAFFQ